ncbi:hypothetical protein KA005_39980, partial [bacterium]|nr:hypothetical protein [bacterium]
EYHVIFEGTERNLTYSLINYTKNDTIITDSTKFGIDTVGAQIIDGFILKLQNWGLDKITEIPGKSSAIKQVVELKGPGGADLETPLDVFERTNSTGEWEINSYGLSEDLKQELNLHDAAGYLNYEIRFTSSGSEYFTTGSFFGFTPWRSDDPKAADKVPFEIWNAGRTDSDADDVRLTIKTIDAYASNLDDSLHVDQDGKWSQLTEGPNAGDWEPIIAYFTDSTYSEPLPESSGLILDVSRFKLGKIIIRGDLPEEGTVIGVNAWKPWSAEDVYSAIAVQPDRQDYDAAQANKDKISVFPNPYFGANSLERDKYQRFVRFTNLPTQATVRIFTLAGVYIQLLEKNDDTQWLDWDLRNRDGLPVASGLYIAHIRMPNVGDKILKIAVIMETQYIDRM